MEALEFQQIVMEKAMDYQDAIDILLEICTKLEDDKIALTRRI